MGDRANVAVVQPDKTRVYLYTHWNGTELVETVHAALSRKVRWDNEAYLARIVFCSMVQEDVGGETGYGISTGLCDNEHPIIVLDPKTQTIWLEDESGKALIRRRSFLSFVEDNIKEFTDRYEEEEEKSR